jgi:hypothetical protein
MDRFRRVALLFGLLLVLLVILANLGLAGPLFGWLYGFPNGDKVAHFLLMGTLSLLASLGFPPRRVNLLSKLPQLLQLPLRPMRPQLLLRPLQSCLIIAGLVTLEELSQALFPGRSASVLDLAASLAGVFLLGEAGALLRKRLTVKAASRLPADL